MYLESILFSKYSSSKIRFSSPSIWYASSIINSWLALVSYVRITESHYIFFDALFYDAKKHRDIKHGLKPSLMDTKSIWDLNEYILNENILKMIDRFSQFSQN